MILKNIINFFYNIFKPKYYYFKDKPYSIFSKTKIKIGEIWVDGIIYRTEYFNPDGIFFVRSEEDFFNRFKLKNK